MSMTTIQDKTYVRIGFLIIWQMVKTRLELISARKLWKNTIVLHLVIYTGHECWIFAYEPETKKQLTMWVFQKEPNLTKVVHARSPSKQTVVCLFVLIGMWTQCRYKIVAQSIRNGTQPYWTGENIESMDHSPSSPGQRFVPNCQK